MATSEKIIIKDSKKKILLQMFTCAAFVILGSWLLTANPGSANTLFETYHIRPIIGGITILIFGSFLVFWINKLIDNKPALIITSNGFIDNSTSLSAGEILWEEVESIRATEVWSNKVITIMVSDPHQFINRQTNAIKRKGMMANFKRNGSPINIQTASLATNHAALKEVLNERFMAYKETLTA